MLMIMYWRLHINRPKYPKPEQKHQSIKPVNEWGWFQSTQYNTQSCFHTDTVLYVSRELYHSYSRSNFSSESHLILLGYDLSSQRLVKRPQKVTEGQEHQLGLVSTLEWHLLKKYNNLLKCSYIREVLWPCKCLAWDKTCLPFPPNPHKCEQFFPKNWRLHIFDIESSPRG